mgnify:CR=1 FL=1
MYLIRVGYLYVGTWDKLYPKERALKFPYRQAVIEMLCWDGAALERICDEEPEPA